MTSEREIRDYTSEYDYDRLIEEEKSHYLEIELTEDLREGGAHASSAWVHYWDGVHARLVRDGYGSFSDYICRRFQHLQRPIRILSLGSGYCGHELNLARQLTLDYTIICTDINEQLFVSAREVSQKESLHLEFKVVDLNFLRIETSSYDVIFAHASLHHVINLELLFSQIKNGLTADGVFHMVEVVGQDRKLIWAKNEKYANALLDTIESEEIGAARIEAHEEDGMEGVRQSEIIDRLRILFDTVYEFRHGAFIRFICTNPEITKQFDVHSSQASKFLNFLIAADDLCVKHGILEPLEVWGIYTPRRDPP